MSHPRETTSGAPRPPVSRPLTATDIAQSIHRPTSAPPNADVVARTQQRVYTTEKHSGPMVTPGRMHRGGSNVPAGGSPAPRPPAPGAAASRPTGSPNLRPSRPPSQNPQHVPYPQQPMIQHTTYPGQAPYPAMYMAPGMVMASSSGSYMGASAHHARPYTSPSPAVYPMTTSATVGQPSTVPGRPPYSPSVTPSNAEPYVPAVPSGSSSAAPRPEREQKEIVSEFRQRILQRMRKKGGSGDSKTPEATATSEAQGVESASAPPAASVAVTTPPATVPATSSTPKVAATTVTTTTAAAAQPSSHPAPAPREEKPAKESSPVGPVAAAPKREATKPAYGCTSNVEFMTNDHDGTDSILYKIQTLIALFPTGVEKEGYWPSKLMVPFRKLVQEPVADSSGKGPRDRRRRDTAGRDAGRGFSRGGAPASDRATSDAAGASVSVGDDWRLATERAAKKKADPYKLLGRASQAFTDRPKDVTEVGQAKKLVTDVCNKLSRDTFKKLSDKLLKELKITSDEMLREVVDLIFDKALEFQVFQDLFADLCALLSAKSDQTWFKSFLVVEEREGGEWYYDVSGSRHGSDGQPNWKGPYRTAEEAERHAASRHSFKRLLLNRAQKEFKGDKSKELDQQEQEDEAKLEEARRTSPSGAPPADMVRETENRRQERAKQRIKYRKRTLANIGFIGHLYMVKLLNELIISICVRTLTNDYHVDKMDEESIEALCKLLLLVGKNYEKMVPVLKSSGKDIPSMDEIFSRTINVLVKLKSISSRLRFRCQDVLDARANKWRLPEHHVAAAAKVMGKEEFRQQVAKEERQKRIAMEKMQSRYANDREFHRAAAGRPAGMRSMGQEARVADLGPSRHEMRRPQGDAAQRGGKTSLLGSRPAFGPRSRLMRRGKEQETPAAAASAPIEAPEAQPAVSLEELERAQQRVENTLKEFADIKQVTELVENLRSLKDTIPDLGTIIIVTAIKAARKAKSDSERLASRDALGHLAEAGFITSSCLGSAMAEYLPLFRTEQEDAPNMDKYLATVISKLTGRWPSTVLDVAKACGSFGGFRGGAGTQIVAAVVTTTFTKEDGSLDTAKVKGEFSRLQAERCGLAALYGPGALAKTVDKLNHYGVTPEVSADVAVLGAAKAFSRGNKMQLDAVEEASLRSSASFVRIAVAEMIHAAGDMGMGPEDAADDLAWLEKKADVLQALAADLADEDLYAVLETAVQTIQSNAHGLYEPDWLPLITRAYLTWLVEKNVVTQEQMTGWKRWKPTAPLGWAHGAAIKALISK